VPRLTRLLVAGVAALAIAGPPAGCGGSSDKHGNAGGNNGGTASTNAAGGKRPPRSAEVRPPRLVRADKRAYTTIQKASGDLRAAATPVTYGATGRIATHQLNTDFRKLLALSPQSALLRRRRVQTMPALRSATSRGASGKAVAAAATAEADRIDSGLRRYAASNPAANEIAPG
jgi:hypothetical protein